MPYYPSKDQSGHYNIETLDLKLVYNYTGFNFKEIYELPIFEYWLYLRDAFIYRCNQSEEGKKYLDDAYRLTQTDIDRGALFKFTKGGK